MKISTLKQVSTFTENIDKGVAEVKLSFKSGNNKVATVSKCGKITAIAEGNVSITITAKLADGTSSKYIIKLIAKKPSITFIKTYKITTNYGAN